MLTIILLLIFVYSAYVSYRRGLVYQGILTIGYFLSLGIASLLYRFLIPLVTLWVPYPSASPDSKFVFYSSEIGLNLDEPFYACVSFLIVLIISWLIIRVILHGFTQLRFLKIESVLNGLGAILLSLIVTSITISLFLIMFSMIPFDFIQDTINSSILAKSLVLYTPIFSNLFKQMFI